ncbi:MAG TPA: MaoC family dehydratase N-terminal domain-containing protein [Acidimicrobiia bacterium]|nr:MaoC family dehydratase N-terminal domain-containing protein [Acidimicrobiia bacterium]
MPVDTSVIGTKTGAWRVTVDRAPVANFARVLGDKTPVLADTPAPPTYSFVMAHWGAYPDDQPPDPSGGANPMHKIMGELHAKGALVLHGEQEFDYHRPIVSGDVLDGAQSITDIYEKETDAATMTFVVMETRWTDANSGDPVVTERFNLIARLRK